MIMEAEKSSKYAKRVLFVCLGNICRSPAAEGIMKKIVAEKGWASDWVIDSAGTGDWHIGELPDSRMRAAGARRGYRFDHRCRQLRASDFDEFDMIIGMDDQNIRNIRLFAPSREKWRKVHHIGEWLEPAEGTYVPDPYYGDERDFNLAIDLLEAACERIFMRLTAQRNC